MNAYRPMLYCKYEVHSCASRKEFLFMARTKNCRSASGSGNIRKLQQRVVIFAVAVGRNQDGRRPAALHAAQRLHRRRGNASSIYGDAK